MFWLDKGEVFSVVHSNIISAPSSRRFSALPPLYILTDDTLTETFLPSNYNVWSKVRPPGCTTDPTFGRLKEQNMNLDQLTANRHCGSFLKNSLRTTEGPSCRTDFETEDGKAKFLTVPWHSDNICSYINSKWCISWRSCKTHAKT